MRNNNIPVSPNIEKFFINSSGEAGKSGPRVNGYFGNSTQTKMAFPFGYYAVPDDDEQVISINPFNDSNQRTIIGATPNYSFNMPPGSRMLYNGKTQLVLAPDGRVIVNGTGKITIQNGNGKITIEEDGVINLN